MSLDPNSASSESDRSRGHTFSRRALLGAAGSMGFAAVVGIDRLPGASAVENGQLAAIGMTTEWASNPLGTDAVAPRLGWTLSSPGYGAEQTAYRLRVSSTAELAAAGQADVWDSGKVASHQSIAVPWGGPELHPQTRYHWTVQVWDENGQPGRPSEPAWFETGMLGAEGWTGRWIGPAPQVVPELGFDGTSWIWSPGATADDAPVGDRWFRGALTFPDGATVRSATLIATADDDFTAWVSGEQVMGTPVRTDGWRQAQSADVTEQVRAGADRVVVAIRATNRPGPVINPGGLLLRLVVALDDDTQVELVSDDSWRSADAVETGWEQPDTDDSGWDAVAVLAPYGQGPWGSGVTVVAPTRPAPLLRRRFTLPADAVSARLYSCGIAFQELWINGSRVGDSVLDPGFTAYDRTLLYATHDVTDLLHSGDNVIGVELGRGFLSMTVGNAWQWNEARWRDDPMLLLHMVVRHADGSETVVESDESWMVADGPTVFDSLYEGETYDARLAQSGWSNVNFDDAGWAPVSRREPPGGRLTAQENEPIRVTESIEVTWNSLGDGRWVADAGRVIAGRSRLRVRAPEGTVVRLIHGEKLRDDGTVIAENGLVHSPRCQLDEYIAAGTGDTEEWVARFSWKGFRYVQVEGLPSAPASDTLVAEVVHSDVSRIAEFSSSEPLYETFDLAMGRTILNNLHSFPTDTPLYEKNGWTGDAQVGAPTMAMSFDMSRLLHKWLGDMRDAQASSGQIPVIVPSGGWGYRELAPSPEWTTVYPYLVRELHRWYGDDRQLTGHWGPVTAYLDWELDRLVDGLAVTALGDYLSPGYGGNPPEDTRLTASSYLHRALISAAEVGEMIGEVATAERYRIAASTLRDQINETFLDLDAGHYRTHRDPEYRQTSNVIPVAFGIVPDADRQRVVDSVAADVRTRGNRLNTGNLGTSALLPVLTDHGYADVAVDVALQTTYPSWGHWFVNGADTMWEMWHLGSRSRNHYFQGTVVEWLMTHVAGLQPLSNGWETFRCRPVARSRVTRASLAVDTVRGRVSSSWRQVGNAYIHEVTVPVGATAEVHVPADAPSAVVVTPSQGVVVDRVEGGSVVYGAPAGNWRFLKHP